MDFKRLFIALTLVSLAVSCAKEAEEKKGGDTPVKPDPDPVVKVDTTKIKVMSFNCLTVSDEAAASYDDKWATRKPAQIQMFGEIAPDLVGLQECQTSAQVFVDAYPDYGMFKTPVEGSNTKAFLGPIILYKKSRVTVLDSGHFWLGDTPDSPCTPFGASDTHYRITTWVKCLVKGCQDTVYLYNTHFPYKSEDHPQREKCSELIIKKMKENARTKSICFLTGDFNQAHFSAKGVEHANAYCLKPLFDWMKEGRETAGFTDSYGSHSASATGAPLSNPSYDLDHIFYRNTSAITFSTITKTYGIKYLSDHYPIVLVVNAKYTYTGNPEDDKWDEEKPDDPKPDDPTPEDPTEYGIGNAAQLLEFADSVNAGKSTEKWQNEEGAVVLLKDIDMSSVKKWTPIGYACTVFNYGVSVTSGRPFTGTFDGNGFTIKNFVVNTTVGSENWNYGFFGTIGEGGCVKNLKFDSSCSVAVTTTAPTNVGVLSGAVYSADVRDIASEATFTVTGKSGGRTYAGGLIGYSYSLSGHPYTYDSLISAGDITFANGDGNQLKDYKGYTIGGITGFSDNTGGVSGVISECINKSKITSLAHRSGGIVGTVSKNDIINNCENSGNITNSYAVKWYGRSGGICCAAGTSVKFTGCRNYGDCIMTNYGYSGGILCLIGGNGIEISKCENYGTILSGSASRGLIFGYAQAYTSTISGCIVDGKIGSIAAPNNINNPGWDEYSEQEKVKYLGYTDSKSTIPTISDITYAIQTGGKPAVDYANAKLKILFIGNSFTLDAVNRLPGFISAAGLDGIQLTHMYYGGRTIPEYYDGWSSAKDYSCFQLGPGRETWATQKDYTLSDIVSITNWDIITIQEHTGTASAWSWEKESSRVQGVTEKSAVEGLVAKIREACPNKNVKLYYLLSQAYGQGHSILTKYPSYFTGQDGMFKCICDQAKKVMETGEFAGVISTAAMLQNLRKTSLNTEMDLTRDGYHMDYGRSRYGAAALVFETLITPSSYADGKNLDDTTYRVTESNTTSGTYCTPVDDAAADICIKAARAAIQKPYEVTEIK